MNRIYTIIILFFLSFSAYSQETVEEKEAPAFKLLRAEEDYSFLKDKDENPFKEDALDAIKFIPLNESKSIYATIGGEIRPRIEHYSNRAFNGEEDETFYSQRISLYTNLVLGKYVRVFGELFHGYTSNEKEFVQYDELDLHQAFIEFKIDIGDTDNVFFRFGRQELTFGATRLVGIREGPNIRRTFDAARAIFISGSVNLQGFYGKEVRPLFYVFDNEFSLFNSNATNPLLWGVYSQFKIKGDPGKNELYYLGFKSKFSEFSDVTGEEKRHTLGLRRFGELGERFSYNTELMYQFGDLDNATISTFSFETDWHYQLINTTWKPNIGLKLDWSSGDKNTGDTKVNTFNPMFVNPSYFGLAGNVTPINLISLHPSVQLFPTEKLKIYLEWAAFWRTSENDGFYSPPRFLVRPTAGIADKQIGSQLALKAQYELGRHWSVDFEMSYFIAGDFLKASGNSENIFHIAPTVSYKF
jgi:hypothetical protein